MNLRLFFTLFSISVLFSSCNINKVHPVPNMPFDIMVNLNLPLYSSLLGVGGYAIVDDAGFNGVIIYRRSLHEFIAFDLQSPADDANCTQPLQVDPSNFLILTDACNGAQFSLFDGSPISGSKFGLRMYSVQYDGMTTLRVMN